jgi:hypothetical protein
MVTDCIIRNYMVLILVQIFNNCESLWKLFLRNESTVMKVMSAFVHSGSFLTRNYMH